MSAYDLILQGGTLYNPCAGTMELCDLAIKDGKIAAHGKNLNAADAETVMDVTGLIVSPGLIDMHCHVYPVFPYQMPDSLRTINAEEYMFRAGVTTAVDAGTTGWRNFGDFKENVIDATKVRVLAFIDMAAKGMHYPPSEQAVADINPEITAAVANTWSDVIVGVKSAHYWAKHEDADHPIWASIDGAIKAASMSGKIVMVDSIPIVPERSYPDILARLRPGDVHTHVFAQQFPLMDENGRMQPYMLAERERGVHFDVGHGSGSFWFRQAVGCFNQGLPRWASASPRISSGLKIMMCGCFAIQTSLFQAQACRVGFTCSVRPCGGGAALRHNRRGRYLPGACSNLSGSRGSGRGRPRR